MARSVEGLRRPALEVTDIPLDSITPDESNPNVMDDARVLALREDIGEHGFVQPLLVRPNGTDGFTIIDGEHRWRVLGELGAETAPCVVTDDSDDDARIRMLTMNRLRGSFAPVRLAYVLADLAKRIPEAELRRRLALDEGELRDSLALADMPDNAGDVVRKAVASERKRAPTVLSFVLAPKLAREVEDVLGRVSAPDRSAALVEVCRAYKADA